MSDDGISLPVEDLARIAELARSNDAAWVDIRWQALAQPDVSWWVSHTPKLRTLLITLSAPSSQLDAVPPARFLYVWREKGVTIVALDT